MTILSQEFVFAALEAEKSGTEYPIDFDDVWNALGYGRKADAKRALNNKLIENFDFIIDNALLRNLTTTTVLSPQEKASLMRTEVINLSIEAFKMFCMLAETPEGREVRKYFIDIEREYRQNLERQFAISEDNAIAGLENQVLTLQEAYQASQRQVYDLSFAVIRLEEKLKPFEKQLSQEFEFDLDTLWSMSGLTANRNYLIGIVLDNFELGLHFVTTPDIRPTKGGLPKTKYWLTEQCFNQLVISLRSIKGVPIELLPESLVIKIEDYFRPNSRKKNSRFPNRNK